PKRNRTLPLGFVHIIESPSANDLLDGRTEGRVLNEIFNLANIPHCYNLVRNLDTFIAALTTDLIKAVNDFQQRPILHFSMHGDEDGNGIGLTDNTFISWDDLQVILAPINNAMKGELLICMSSCFSSSGVQMAKYESKDEPFWALVSNKSSVDWDNAAVAYTTFYHLLFKNTNISITSVEECVERMRLASSDDNFEVCLGHEIKANWTEDIRKLFIEQLLERLKNCDKEVRQRIISRIKASKK
ncbi:MAG TPA: hypothetical protein VIQ31_02435, partial [Phormidium sp.]